MSASKTPHSSGANLPAYFARFGLKREPFSAAVEDDMFYSEAEDGEFYRTNLSRSQRLNLLLHLAPYSDALLVTGEAGIGKTTLLHQFLARIEPSWRVCAVSASPTVNNDVIFQCLSREFAKEEEAISLPGLNKADSLRDHIRSLRESSLSPILIIDDAHELSKEVLGFLLNLVQTDKNGDKLLSIIMFSEPGIDKILESGDLAPLRNLVSHSFELVPFNEEDTTNYIKHRLNIAGLTGDSPFTPAVVKVIYETSHGIPAKINELAQVVLNNSASVELPPMAFDSPRKTTTIFKRYGPVGAIVVLLLIVLIFQDNINSTFVTKDADKTEKTIARNEQTASKPESGSISHPPSQAANSGSEKDQATDKEPAAEDTNNITQAPVGMVARNEKSSPDLKLRDKVVTETESLSGPGNEKVIDGRDDRNIATVDVVVTDKEKQVATVSNTAGDNTAAEKSPASEQTVQKKPAGLQTETSSPAAPKQAVLQTAEAIHREDWLITQDPHAYTLQLIALREEVIIIRYIKDHDLQDKAAYFSTDKNNTEWFAVVYGIYSTRKDAENAVKQLQARIPRVKPWIRSLQSVQDTITAYRAQQTSAEPR